MLCKNPYVRGGKAFGCGQCLPCRFNRARIWTHRLTLEALQHKENCFLTLTYAEEPPGNSLSKRDLQLFMKRLRKDVYPRKVRFFACGEYGEQHGRPHYHVALFGLPTCRRGQTQWRRHSKTCCEVCDRMLRLWEHGLVYLGSLEPASARYVTGYVVKKLNRDDDPRLGVDQIPEFAVMSRRPGIGSTAMDEVASVLLTHHPDMPDVPTVLQHGRYRMPLGRYLRRELRHKMGREKNAPETAIKEMEEKMRPLRELAHSYAPRGFKDFTFKNAIIDANQGARTNLEAKIRRTSKKGSQ